MPQDQGQPDGVTPDLIPIRFPRMRTVWGFVAVGVVFKLIVLAIAPVHYDTNYYLNIARSYIDYGLLTPYMWRLPAASNIIAGAGTGYGILVPMLWLQLFGLSPVAGRVFSMLCSLGMLAAVWGAARLWYGARAGRYALILGAVSTAWLSVYSLRLDAFALLAYGLVFYVYALAHHRRVGWLHVAVGVSLVLAAEVHILSIIYIGGFTLAYAVEFVAAVMQERRLPWRHPALSYAAGGAVAGLVYIVIRILPDPAAYFLIPSDCPSCSVRSVGQELARFLNALTRFPLEVMLFAVAVVDAALSQGERNRRYLSLSLGCLLSIVIINPPSQAHYTAHLLPLVLIGAVALFARGHNDVERPRWRRWFMPVAVAFIGVNIAYLPFWWLQRTEPDPRVAYIEANIPADAVVMGTNLLYHDLTEYPNFLAYRDGTEYTISLQNERITDFWQREAPVVFLPAVAPYQVDPFNLDWQTDAALLDYLDREGFEEVESGIWLHPDLIVE